MTYQANNQKNSVDLDQGLIWTVVFLLGLGLVMVYSASIAIADAGRGAGGAGYYLIRHTAYLAVGLLLGLLAFLVPMRAWQKYAVHLLAFGTLLHEIFVCFVFGFC